MQVTKLDTLAGIAVKYNVSVRLRFCCSDWQSGAATLALLA